MYEYTQHKQLDVSATKGTKGFNATSRDRPNERSNSGADCFSAHTKPLWSEANNTCSK